jgi:uncharacterized protein
LWARLPLITHDTINNIRISIVHETGVPAGREARMQAAYPETDLLIFGHSHIP